VDLQFCHTVKHLRSSENRRQLAISPRWWSRLRWYCSSQKRTGQRVL